VLKENAHFIAETLQSLRTHYLGTKFAQLGNCDLHQYAGSTPELRRHLESGWRRTGELADVSDCHAVCWRHELVFEFWQADFVIDRRRFGLEDGLFVELFEDG